MPNYLEYIAKWFNVYQLCRKVKNNFMNKEFHDFLNHFTKEVLDKHSKTIYIDEAYKDGFWLDSKEGTFFI